LRLAPLDRQRSAASWPYFRLGGLSIRDAHKKKPVASDAGDRL
jgi:hypothetical protein